MTLDRKRKCLRALQSFAQTTWRLEGPSEWPQRGSKSGSTESVQGLHCLHSLGEAAADDIRHPQRESALSV